MESYVPLKSANIQPGTWNMFYYSNSGLGGDQL
jgi:hypothetical protein